MRKSFVEYLYKLMSEDNKIWLVTADLGFGLFDKIQDSFPDRFINCGASEVAGLGLCVGLAYEKKIPIFYSITPFAIFRPFEVIRNYMHNEGVPVKIVGGGRWKDYETEGYSHWPIEQWDILKPLNVKQYCPNQLTNKMVKDFLYNGLPSYMNLKR